MKTDRRARRLAIAQRRQRIAAQPRVGDVVIGYGYHRMTVLWKGPVNGKIAIEMSTPYGNVQNALSLDQWREVVRRARVTQESA